ncbi:hypothetical protein JTE90_023082 [Oedothorax gibbosus]|uniref:NADH dehydrogenase subunit 6 n=1 Tax=Oedothorax gibbosus TaxID=931172 RepID=A0AAV6UWC2_9ARAC|nr:hypothetical protein JTE90_023082 [Oedothorax gibbosus]
MYRAYSIFFSFLSVISFVSGIAAFVYFLFFAANIHASVWSLLSAIFSACSLHLFTLQLRRTLIDWYTLSNLEGISSFGLVIFLLTDVALGVYLSLAIVRHQSFTLEKYSYYVAACCAAGTSIWSFMLFLSSLLFRRFIMQNPPLLRNFRSYS